MLQLRFKYQMCAYNGILFSLKKGDPALRNHVDEPGGHHAK